MNAFFLRYSVGFLSFMAVLLGSIGVISNAQTITQTPAAQSPAKAQKATPSNAVLINATTRNHKQSATALALSRNGQALWPVVISATASDTVKLAANELAEYLGRISGATFEVKTGDGSTGIVLGNIKEFPHSSLNKALAIVNGFDGKEAFAIRTGENRLLLLGATDLGASHAAYRVLHELGVRWFWPNKAWEVLPAVNPNMTWNLDITDRPSILSRVIWFQAGSGTPDAEKAYRDWRRRNLKAESFKSNTGHALFNVPRIFAEEFKAHPEYYAIDAQGKPILDDIELTNPNVRKLVVEYARRYFKENPDADMVSIDPADHAKHSQRPEALKIPYSDQIFGVANEVARMLQKEFPGKVVGLYSYNDHSDPPSFKLEPNVHVQITSMRGLSPRYTREERDRIWPLRSSNLGVYEYYSVFAWTQDKLPGSYVNGVRGLQQHIRDKLVARNIVSVSAESTSAWGVNGRGYYFATRLMWNPDVDLAAMVRDYHEKAFGPAAEPMEKYFECFSADNNPLMSAHLLGLAFREIDRATKLAVNRPDVLERIDQLKLYLRYADLAWRKWNDHLPIKDEELMSHLFRTRELALTSWEMIRQQWGGGKYPGQPDAPAWMVDKPYTHEEIETDFQDGLRYYEPRIRDVGPRLTYSNRLVPIQWPEQALLQEESTQVYQGSIQYVFYSPNGEPLEFTTEAGDAWGYKTSYTVTGFSGKVIASGKPEAKVKITHEIPVPAPGLYYLNYDDPGAYWTFTAKPEAIFSIIVLPEVTNGRTARHLPDVYFYVPKGTKKLEYFATHSHWVIGPDGSVQQRVEKGNDYITVPIPPGMDGKQWRFRELNLGKIYFNNAPSYFSTSPHALLVPREIAEQDGLTILK